MQIGINLGFTNSKQKINISNTLGLVRHILGAGYWVLGNEKRERNTKTTNHGFLNS